MQKVTLNSFALIHFFVLELFANGAILFILIKMSAFLFLGMAVQNGPVLGFIFKDFLSCLIKCGLCFSNSEWPLQEYSLFFLKEDFELLLRGAILLMKTNKLLTITNMRIIRILGNRFIVLTLL